MNTGSWTMPNWNTSPPECAPIGNWERDRFRTWSLSRKTPEWWLGLMRLVRHELTGRALGAEPTSGHTSYWLRTNTPHLDAKWIWRTNWLTLCFTTASMRIV